MTIASQPTVLSPEPASEPMAPALRFEDVAVSFKGHVAVRGVTLEVPARQVTTLVGPSGCGKTTLLRAVNRMHDHLGGRVEGHVVLGDLDVYGPGTRAELVRSRVGMVFQRPNPFPTMTIFDNVVSGLRFAGIRKKSLLKEAAEVALRQAALWDLVEHRLHQPALRLSGGQQQRLCIARALAVQPEMLLMDEPCSALDPIATAKVEQLITRLAARRHCCARHAQHVPGGQGFGLRRRAADGRGPRGRTGRGGPGGRGPALAQGPTNDGLRERARRLKR